MDLFGYEITMQVAIHEDFAISILDFRYDENEDVYYCEKSEDMIFSPPIKKSIADFMQIDFKLCSKHIIPITKIDFSSKKPIFKPFECVAVTFDNKTVRLGTICEAEKIPTTGYIQRGHSLFPDDLDTYENYYYVENCIYTYVVMFSNGKKESFYSNDLFKFENLTFENEQIL